MTKKTSRLINLISFWLSIPIGIYAHDADHILITRIVTQPDAAELISIFNPTNAPINLTDYYICDDEEYYKMQTEGDMAPSSSISGFTAQFPDIFITPGDTFHIILNENYNEFYGEEFVPHLKMYGSYDNSLDETETGSIGFSNNKIAENSELIILFKWDGSNNLIEDIDYFLWGAYQLPVNKTAISTYQDDTPIEDQLFFEEEAESNYAYSRIGIDEIIETDVGGNGITGHDETSENFRESWEITSIVNLGCTDSNAPNYDPEAEIDDGSCTVSIASILDGEYDDEYARVEGLIVDYFDITVFNGPHSLTISDEDNNELEISIWSDTMTDSLFMLTGYPMAKYRVSVYGMIDLYPDANNNGICDEPDEDSDCSLPPSLWECEGESETANGFNSDGLNRAVNNHCKWQLQLANASDLTIIDTIVVEYPLIEFSELLSYSNDVKASPWFHKNITIQGLLVDYVNITESCGPHVMTLEDSDQYRLEVITFDANWSNSLSCLTLPPYGTKYIDVKGYVGEYENEIQISFDNESAIELLGNYSFDGDFTAGQGGCFADDGNFIEVGKQACEDQDYQWVKTNVVKIIPVSYVIIPSLNERLDFSFFSPVGARTIVRIFDLSGRFITSLVDRYDHQEGVVVHNAHKTSWNGRDHLGQIVAPGTYILHLEAINFTTGLTTTDIAPIVVGIKK